MREDYLNILEELVKIYEKGELILDERNIKRVANYLNKAKVLKISEGLKAEMDDLEFENEDEKLK